MTPDFLPHLTQVLLFHVVPDAEIFAANLTDGQVATTLSMDNLTVSVGDTVALAPAFGGLATVVTADVEASNGIVHVIDAVLTPPFLSTTFIDLLGATPGFTTLSALVTAAGFGDLFSDPTSAYTVFAPNDVAFAAAFETLGEEAVAFLTSADGFETVQTILLYHVLPGVTMSDELEDGAVVTTASEQTVTVSLMDGMAKINDATVVMADLLTVNGVAHVIDAVLVPDIGPLPPVMETMPPTTAPTESTSAAATVTALGAAATVLAGVVF